MGKRGKIIEQIERQLSRLDNQPGLCLFYAHHTVSVLARHGYKAVVQAGSMQWPRIPMDQDDGRMHTHFAYEWSPHDPASAVSVAMGNLPEMHVWVGLLDTQEIVDFATRHLKTAAQAADLEWTAPEPPRYLWCPANQLPEWVIYRPNAEATIYACTILKRLFNPVYLKR